MRGTTAFQMLAQCFLQVVVAAALLTGPSWAFTVPGMMGLRRCGKFVGSASSFEARVLPSVPRMVRKKETLWFAAGSGTLSRDQTESVEGATELAEPYNREETVPAMGESLKTASDGEAGEQVSARDMQYPSGTKAVTLPIGTEATVIDDLLTLLFQIGGRFLWPGDDAVVAIGHLKDLVGGNPLFMPLYKYFRQNGGVYKLSFAPVPQATFYVLSDPRAIKAVLKDHTFSFNKGMLAEILEPILGTGLIPADISVWKARRPVIQPGFHLRWLERMAGTFNECAELMITELDKKAAAGEAVNMESVFNSVSLDIIGKAVFNYDFGSVTSESPVIKAAYACLKEAEHRATFLVPYWNIPVIGQGPFAVVPRQREFYGHLQVLNNKLNEMIRDARASENKGDLEALESRNYQVLQDPSLLRFLVDLRGGDCDDKQLRDDLMTLLVAGHETTGSLLTWTAFELAQHPEELRKAQDEVDRVLAGRAPTLEDIKRLDCIRLILTEGLRLYPQPPILLRRCLSEVKLPAAHAGDVERGDERGMQFKGVTLSRDANVFVSVWNLHRNPTLWENPNDFKPDRFRHKIAGVSHPEWDGYTPKEPLGMYPNEVDANFGFIPFGGGQRKCVGDQFAMMEAVVILARILQHYEISLSGSADEVGMSTGATIHTKNGLWMNLARRK